MPTKTAQLKHIISENYSYCNGLWTDLVSVQRNNDCCFGISDSNLYMAFEVYILSPELFNSQFIICVEIVNLCWQFANRFIPAGAFWCLHCFDDKHRIVNKYRQIIIMHEKIQFSVQNSTCIPCVCNKILDSTRFPNRFSGPLVF